jgi:hypothetical protein
MAPLNCSMRLRAISLGDSSQCAIQFLVARPSAVADTTAPISHITPPTHRRTRPPRSVPVSTSNAGRGVELLIVVPFTSEWVANATIGGRDGSHHALIHPAGRHSARLNWCRRGPRVAMMGTRPAHLDRTVGPRHRSTDPMESNMHKRGMSAQLTARDDFAGMCRPLAAIVAGLLLGTAAVPGSRGAGTP